MLRPLTLPIHVRSLALTLALTACSSGATGTSGTFNVPSTETDDGESTDGETEVATVTATDGPQDTTSSSSTSGTGPGPSATGTSSGDAPGDAAVLEWSVDDPQLDFGAVPVDDAATATIELENVGGLPATSLTTGLIPGNFSFPGGYPGAGGDCDVDLAPGTSCRLALRYGPTAVGPVESQLVLEYFDGLDLGAPTQTAPLVLRGGGQGTSANLLTNGDAETGEVAPWATGVGQGNWQTTDEAFGGEFAFSPTGAFLITSLNQDVGLGPWRHSTSVPGVRYRVRARVRSDGDHLYRLLLTVGDAAPILLDEGSETSWTLIEATDVLPPEGEGATVRLECENSEAGAPCNVLVDDVMLQMTYP